MKQQITLTEKQLNAMISEAVMRVMNESTDEGFGDMFRFGANKAKQGIANTANKVGAGIQNAAQNGAAMAQNAYNSVKGGVQNAYNGVKGGVQNAYNNASKAVGDFAANAREYSNNMDQMRENQKLAQQAMKYKNMVDQMLQSPVLSTANQQVKGIGQQFSKTLELFANQFTNGANSFKDDANGMLAGNAEVSEAVSRVIKEYLK